MPERVPAVEPIEIADRIEIAEVGLEREPE